MKEKKLVSLPTRKKEKRKADPHLAHCLLPNTQTNAKKKSESQILPLQIISAIKLIITL